MPGGDQQLRVQPGVAPSNSPCIEVWLHHLRNSRSRRLLAANAPRQKLVAPRSHLARGSAPGGGVGAFGASCEHHRSKPASSKYGYIATMFADAMICATYRACFNVGKSTKVYLQSRPACAPARPPPAKPAGTARVHAAHKPPASGQAAPVSGLGPGPLGAGRPFVTGCQIKTPISHFAKRKQTLYRPAKASWVGPGGLCLQ